MSRVVPDGVFLDADGLAEIDLGNGTNYNPQEALNMYFQTGSVIGRSMTQDGDFNNGRMPIQELQSSGGNAKIAALIQSYNYYLQMMRDVTGLNEARDGSMPDKASLVGLQKIAAANSNTATRHILQAGLYITLKTAEAISLRISDVLEYSKTKNQFILSLGRFNVGTLNQVKELHMHDFGIFLELAPDDEEKQLLENNIQMALQQQQINLEDAIDVRQVRNLKLANQVLKIRKKKKQDQDQALAQQNIQAQAQANAQAAEQAAQAEAQKNQVITEQKVQLAQSESNFDIMKMEREAEIKKELMEHEFNLNMRLKDMESQVIKDKEEYKEDRKDERTRIQASQQSKMIEQRKKDLPAEKFESKGFDNLGGFDLEQFEPR
jgi:DNA polymerase III gamma/tau subunit